MNKAGLGHVLFLSLALVAGAPSHAANESTQAAVNEILSHDGLERIKTREADLVYARPGASLAGYSKVIIGPVDVAFSKNWDPKRTGSPFKLSSEEREEIRSGVSRIVRDEFVKTLQGKDGYPVVESASPDALLLKIGIINLVVNAPDAPTAGRSRTYVSSAGEMTLVLEILDSETKQVLARAVDRQESDMRGVGQMTWTNRIVNAGEAEMIASAWARKLRKSLDKAHGIGGK